MDESIKELLQSKNSRLKLKALLLLLKEYSGCMQNAKHMFDHRWIESAADAAIYYKKCANEIEEQILNMFEDKFNES
jgi:hypothetical protein